MSGSNGVARRGPGELGALDHCYAVGGEYHERVDVERVLHEDRVGRNNELPLKRVLEPAYERGPAGRAVDERGRQRRPHERPRREVESELLERDRGLDCTEADAAVGLRDHEPEDPEVGELAPACPVDRLPFAPGGALDAEMVRAIASDRVAERDLPVVQAELHRGRRLPLRGRRRNI